MSDEDERKIPDFAEENATRTASEVITHYDPATDVYHCSYAAPIPARTIHDETRGILVRIDPRTRQVLGFTIPSFKEWYATNHPDGGEFEVDLPPVWPDDGAAADEG